MRGGGGVRCGVMRGAGGGGDDKLGGVRKGVKDGVGCGM
jgi:hypothetical protein